MDTLEKKIEELQSKIEALKLKSVSTVISKNNREAARQARIDNGSKIKKGRQQPIFSWGEYWKAAGMYEQNMSSENAWVEHRQSSAITITQLSKILNTTIDRVCRMERGDSPILKSHALIIEELFKIKLNPIGIKLDV